MNLICNISVTEHKPGSLQRMAVFYFYFFRIVLNAVLRVSMIQWQQCSGCGRSIFRRAPDIGVVIETQKLVLSCKSIMYDA